MAHFAQLDSNNVVLQVIVVGNDQLKETIITETNGLLTFQYVESEAKGIEFCKSLFGADTIWKQTSYNNNFRGKYAGVGYTFVDGKFVAPETPVVQPVETTQVESLSTTQIDNLTTSQISSLGV
jgi:hypothetical protein